MITSSACSAMRTRRPASSVAASDDWPSSGSNIQTFKQSKARVKQTVKRQEPVYIHLPYTYGNGALRHSKARDLIRSHLSAGQVFTSLGRTCLHVGESLLEVGGVVPSLAQLLTQLVGLLFIIRAHKQGERERHKAEDQKEGSKAGGEDRKRRLRIPTERRGYRRDQEDST